MIHTEFFNGPDGEIMLRIGKNLQIITEDDKDIINEILSKVEIDYPLAYKRLYDLYSGKWQYRWLMFRRFVSCNFGNHDNIDDQDEQNTFNFEHVSCPIRCECNDCNVICHPEFNTELTKREKQVLALICTNKTDQEIADELFNAIDTIKNHRRSIERKLNQKNKLGIVEYAKRHNIK